MNIYLRLFVCLLATLMCLCSCGTQYEYDENGEFRVIDGQLPEELPEPEDMYLRAPPSGCVSFQEYIGGFRDGVINGYVVFRARKIQSESISTKDSSLEYTMTKLEILDVYMNEGVIYKDFASGETVDILENYTFVPDGNQMEFKEVDFLRVYADKSYNGGYSSNINIGRAYEYVQPEKEYIVILINRYPDREKVIANSEEGPSIIDNDEFDSIFVPDMIQAVDEQRYADMLTKEEYTMPVEERPRKRWLALYDYFYFDILSQYVFNEK